MKTPIMYVVSATNRRKDSPSMDMVSMFNDGLDRATQWKTSFMSSPIKVLLTDVTDSLSFSLKIRGYMHDLSSPSSPVEKRVTDVFVGGTRVPISETSVVGRKGNKFIIDASFVVSVSDVNMVDKNTWSFLLSAPQGFNTMTLCSPDTPTKYLYSLVQEPSAMATEVSPVSFILMWPQGPRAPSVTINEVPVDLPKKSPNRLSVQASSETKYICVVDNGSKKYEVVVNTPAITKKSLSIHYRSCIVESGAFDLSHTDQGTIRDLRRFGVIRPGDRVILASSTNPLVAVGSGETITESGSFYVIPSFVEGTEQYLCMETQEGSHIVTFDNSESFVGYDSNRYCHGDKFVIGSKMVEVVKGSLILILHDDVPLLFPGGVTTASQVATAGDIVLRDLILKCSNQVTTKVSGDFTYGISSYYVYNPITGTTLEATRVSHGINDAGDTGSMSFNVLYTPSTGTQLIHNALEIEPSKTTISTIDSSGALEATFDSSGLRFNSDSGDVYFGASQEFRIHYEPSSGNNPSMLQIQGYDSSTSGYVTRQLISNEPVG